jgi:hypothetical protein
MKTSGQPIKDKSFYRAGLLKRKRRTKAQLEQLDNQIYAALKNDHPQSVRHIYYLMTDPRLLECVPKTDEGYNQVQDRCVKLRRSGRIPYEWVADMSRRGYFVNTYSNASEFVSRMAGLYRADLWADSDHRCEVWCESRSIASVIQSVCTELAVDLYPCGGFASLSFAHFAAEQHNQTKDYRPLTIFYIGDYDPAGVMIDRALERELRLHLDSRIDMSFERIGINEDQIAEYDLPTKPRKKSDMRSQQVIFTVEAEAMPAHILRELLRNNIESLLPVGALHAAKVAEQSEREGLKILAKHLRGAQ